MKTASARLSVILARKSDVAVIFRRGPSRRVLLIRWHRTNDSFCFGQWFKGRIYQHRSDLSPSGELLLYFAADHRKPYFSWTAVSRPPFLSALALWPKGDCWGGGGQFKSENRIILNHRPGEMELADSFRLPRRVSVVPFGPHSGWGEDSPLHEATLERDGWALVDPGKAVEHSFGSPTWITFDPPQTWAKVHPVSTGLVLHTMLTGYHRRGGPNRVVEVAVFLHGAPLLSLGETDWADWDANGDLLYSQAGLLYRRRVDHTGAPDAQCILDASGLSFRPLESSHEARSWREPLRLKLETR